MARNDHKSIENSQIHPPKDFSIAENGDRIQKNLNGELMWVGSPWQPNTIDVVDINAAPPTEVNGDRYILIEIASTVADSGWDGAVVDDIVEFSDTNNTWGNRAPQKGDITYNETLEDYYQYDGTEWVVLISGGGGGSITINWKFSTTITDADPGSGNFRLDNATQANATQIFVSDFSESGTDVGAILDSVKIGTDIFIQQFDDSTRYHVATVDGVPTDATTYWKIPITISDSGADLVNNKKCPFIFIGAGADFADGGEAAGKDRTLGNTDNFDLGLLTNNNERLTILNDGKVGINTLIPTVLFQLTSTGISNVFIVTPSTGSAEAKIEENPSNEMNLIMKNTAGTETVKLSTSSGVNSFINAGNIGLGTSTPTSKVHIQVTNTSTTVPQLLVSQVGTGDPMFRLSLAGGNWVQMHLDNSVTDDPFILESINGVHWTMDYMNDAWNVALITTFTDEIYLLGTVFGGTASGANLELVSTEHATKGKIFFGAAQTSAYDEVNDRLGIGTNAPASLLDVTVDGSTSVSAIRIHDSNSSNQRRITMRISTGNGLIELRNTSDVETVQIFSNGDSYFNGGMLGVGNNAPSEALHVTGNIKVTGKFVGLVEGSGGMIEAPSDKTYILDQSAAYAYDIDTLIAKTVSGTLSAAIQIDGTPVTGINTLAVTSTEGTGTASAANSVAIGQTVTMVVTSGSSPVDYSYTLKSTRT